MKIKHAAAAALALIMLLSLCACAKKSRQDIKIGMIKGPSGIGSAYLMAQNDEGKTLNKYAFETASAPTEITGRLVSGELDMAAVPTNVAAALCAKTKGEIQIVALNTLGVLYILENGNTVKSVSDLRGKTVYATGQGSNPEYVLSYILRKNGLEPGRDVNVEYLDSAELAARMASGKADLCMLPVPNATGVLMKSKSVRTALDLTEEWNRVSSGSTLTMGCVVIRKGAKLPAAAVDNFLKEYKASIDYVNKNIPAAAKLVAKYELAGSEEIAAAAIPDCSLVCIGGKSEIKKAVEGYYKVLFAADPSSVGGKMPNDELYYEK